MRVFSRTRQALGLLLALGVTLSGLVLSAPTVRASTVVFDSTNSTSQYATFSVGNAWFAYKFSANTDTTVSTVDVYTTADTGYQDFYVRVATGATTGNLASFLPASVETGVACADRVCAKVTFTGNVDLTAGNDYWLWIGADAPSQVGNYLFRGSSATVPNLPLGHTMGTGDIESSTGSTFDSNNDGYPWVKMFTSTATSSSATSQSTVPEFTINLITSDGAQCTQRDVSAPRGLWVELPAAADCSPPTSQPTATLLGWATNADFPVDIAQRQVNNGWGAYQTFNDDGKLTGVFIPAGGATFVSNSTNLYPIWSE